MARPTTIPRIQILDAARQLFLEQGFSVSTATIAHAAGVSEGTIFKRFGTKNGLFVEAMCPARLEPGLMPTPGEGAIKDALAALAVRLIEFYRELMPRMMRLWAHTQPGEATPMERLRDGAHPPPPVRLRTMLTEYLAAEAKLGRLGAIEPKLVAQTLMATMHNYVFFEMIQCAAHPGSDTDYALGIVDMLWGGLAPNHYKGDPR